MKMKRILLEQSSTFTPFVRELVILTQIPVGTAQYDIIHIMSRIMLRPAYRDSMLKMIDVTPLDLLKLRKAIIALMLLSFELLLYLLSSQCSKNGFLLCAASVLVGFAYSLALLGLPICSTLFLYFFSVSSTICCLLLSITVLLVGLFLFLMFLPILLSLFNMSSIIGFTLSFLTTFTLRTKSLPFSREKLRGSRIGIGALGTLLLRGVLRYDVHTESLLCFSSRQGVLAHCSGNTILPLYYSIHPLEKQVERRYA